MRYQLRYIRVGDTGIEPVTSSVSGKRATAAPIARIDYEYGGGDGIRTRVNGFAGRCLAARPRHQMERKSPGFPEGILSLERMTRLELATLTLARLCATNCATSACTLSGTDSSLPETCTRGRNAPCRACRTARNLCRRIVPSERGYPGMIHSSHAPPLHPPPRRLSSDNLAHSQTSLVSRCGSDSASTACRAFSRSICTTPWSTAASVWTSRWRWVSSARTAVPCTCRLSSARGLLTASLVPSACCLAAPRSSSRATSRSRSFPGLPA